MKLAIIDNEYHILLNGRKKYRPLFYKYYGKYYILKGVNVFLSENLFSKLRIKSNII